MLVCLEQFTHQVLNACTNEGLLSLFCIGIFSCHAIPSLVCSSLSKAWSTFLYLQVNSDDRLKMEIEIFCVCQGLLLIIETITL